MGDEVRVGVLSLHNSKETKAICNAIGELGHQPEWLRGENLRVTTGRSGTRIDPAVDVVVNRLLLPAAETPLTTLGLAATVEATGVPVLNRAGAVATAVHKFAAMCRLAKAGLPVPASTLAIGAHRLEQLGPPTDTDRAPFAEPPTDAADRRERLAPADDEPLDRRVFKRPIGTHGDETSMLESDAHAPQLAGETQGLLQEPIESPTDDHEDLRIYVVDGEPLGAMRRYAPDDDWRTNVARGGRVRDATETLPESVLQLAVEATTLLGLDYAGVDVIEGMNGWYVLEVNTTAGFKGFFEATGVSPAPAIAAAAIRRAGGEVSPDRVAELATRLDDSVPACRPSLQRSPSPDRSVVGYTTEVRIAGRHGARTVVAKADTGATRTSLDLSLAGTVGAGPILDTAHVKGTRDSERPIVPVDVRVGEYTHNVHANVRDRSHLDHDVLLGRDVLESYSVRVDRRHDDSTTEE